MSLYNPNTRRLNLRGLKLGSQIQITYNFEITTMSSNTEVWCRSIFKGSEREYTSFLASFKYQHTYDVSTTHNLCITSIPDRELGIVPQVRSDMDASLKMKSIYISVY